MDLLPIKALSDATRLRLVHILLHYELSVNELVRILGMGQSRVSRHLKILAEAGLLASRRDGLWVFYSAPASGPRLSFLRAVLPFVPADAAMRADLSLAAQVLEERARETRQFFNAIAEDWDELNREVLGPLDLAGIVSAALPAGCGTAVDLGCGTGGVLHRLLPDAGTLIGVDGSARMLDLCRRRFHDEELARGKVSLRIGELSHLPLRDQEANFACINLVLHHLPVPAEGLAEARRIMSPGGTLFLADFLSHNDETMRSRYGDHWLGFDEDKLLAALDRAGFAGAQCRREPVGRGLTLLLMTATAR